MAQYGTTSNHNWLSRGCTIVSGDWASSWTHSSPWRGCATRSCRAETGHDSSAGTTRSNPGSAASLCHLLTQTYWYCSSCSKHWSLSPSLRSQMHPQGLFKANYLSKTLYYYLIYPQPPHLPLPAYPSFSNSWSCLVFSGSPQFLHGKVGEGIEKKYQVFGHNYLIRHLIKISLTGIINAVKKYYSLNENLTETASIIFGFFWTLTYEEVEASPLPHLILLLDLALRTATHPCLFFPNLSKLFSDFRTFLLSGGCHYLKKIIFFIKFNKKSKINFNK